MIWRSSTSSSQTVASFASITISRSTMVFSVATSMLRPFRFFGFSLQGGETLVPELRQKLPQLGQRLRPDAIETPGAVPALPHQPRLFEDGEVLRDRGPRNFEVRGDLTSS